MLKNEAETPFFIARLFALCNLHLQSANCKLYFGYEDTKGGRMVQKKTIGLTLRLDAKYKDVIDYLKMSRGALTRVVECALDSVTVDQELLRRKREFETLADEKFKEVYVSQAEQQDCVVDEDFANVRRQVFKSLTEKNEKLETCGAR